TGGQADQHREDPGQHDDREVGALGPPRQQRADTAVYEDLLEAAAGSHNQDDAGDRRQYRLDGHGQVFAGHAGAPAEGDHADDHRDQQRQQRGTHDVENPPEPLSVVVDEDVDQGLAEPQTDRQQHGEQGDAEGGTAPLGADLRAP